MRFRIRQILERIHHMKERDHCRSNCLFYEYFDICKADKTPQQKRGERE